MTNILHINSSLFGEDGKSSQMANQFIQALRSKLDDSALMSRDLHANPIPHLDGKRFTAFVTPAEQRTEEQKLIVAESDVLINELRDADIIVLGIPLYNVARAGETFRYTANGPEGLLSNKKVYVFAARGGKYVETPMDTQTPYLRHILGLMGISDIEFVYAEGLNMGPDIADKALADARTQLLEKAA